MDSRHRILSPVQAALAGQKIVRPANAALVTKQDSGGAFRYCQELRRGRFGAHTGSRDPKCPSVQAKAQKRLRKNLGLIDEFFSTVQSGGTVGCTCTGGQNGVPAVHSVPCTGGCFRAS